MHLILTGFLTVIALLAVYSVTVLRRLAKKADHVLNESMQTIEAVKADYSVFKGRLDTMTAQAQGYLEMPPSFHLMEAGINFMAHIGASDLGKNGLGLNKEQIGRVTMARQGFNVVGKRIGDGIGVPELLNKADQFAPLVGGGGEAGGGIGGMLGGGGGIAGLVVNFLTGGGLGSGGGPAVKEPSKPSGGDLPPLG